MHYVISLKLKPEMDKIYFDLNFYIFYLNLKFIQKIKFKIFLKMIKNNFM